MTQYLSRLCFNLFRVFEGFLLSRQPAFGLPKYNYWKTAADKKRKIISGDYRAVRVWDECFTAYHRWVVSIGIRSIASMTFIFCLAFHQSRETIGSIIPSFEISFYRNNWWLYGFIPELLVATSYPLESAAIQYEHTVILNKLHRYFGSFFSKFLFLFQWYEFWVVHFFSFNLGEAIP